MNNLNIDILSIILLFTNEITEMLFLTKTFFSKLNTRFFHNNFKMKYTYIGTNNVTYMKKFISVLNIQVFDEKFLDSFNCNSLSKILIGYSINLSDVAKYFNIYKIEMFLHRALLNDKIIIKGEVNDNTIKFFTNIKELKVKNLFFHITPIGMMKLTKLEKLHISIPPIQYATLDTSFLRYMPSLKYLHFQNTQFVPFEDISNLVNLEHLNIGGCNITNLSLKPFAKLTYLSLSVSNIITDELLTNCASTIRKLYINVYNYDSTLSDIIFKHHTNVEYLGLSNCSLIKGKYFGNYFKCLRKLKKLKLGDANNISFECPISIEYLHFNESKNILIENLNSLKNLKLINPSLDYLITNDTLKELHNLEKLYLSGNKINVSMFKYLKQLKKIKVIDIRFCNKLSDNNLRKISTIKELTLISCRNITGIYLDELVNLRKLSLYNIKKICSAELSKLTNLTSLSIEYCKNITDVGLKNLSKIKYLKVNDNFGKILTKDLLCNMENIEYLSVSRTKNVFEGNILLPKLKTLRIEKCLFKDYYLLFMPKLEHLYINVMTIKGTYFDRTNLKYLTLYDSAKIKCIETFTDNIVNATYLLGLKLCDSFGNATGTS